MNFLFYTIEPLIFIAAAYLVFYKKDLSIIYLPALFFASTIINSALPAIVHYAFYSGFILYLIYLHPDFYKKNIYAVLLIVLYFLLIPTSSDLVFIRPTLFSVMWMLFLVPLAISVMEKYPRITLFKELSYSALIILCLFLVNVIASTLFNYSPFEMYGMQSGVLYGNLVATDLNVISIVIFISFFFLSYKGNLIYLLITLVSFSFIVLSMRRSVIVMCIIGIAFVFFILVAKGQAQKVMVIGGITLILSLVIIQTTGFLDLLIERYELRNLENRELAEESRFAEYGILYKDIFVHQDYSPWLGYELLKSGGNYGKGVFGIRSLHGDLTNILHSTGIIGLSLYLMMVGSIFWKAINHIKTVTDLLIICFCFSAFILFTITGRYTQTGYMLFFFLVLLLPVGKSMGEKPVLKHLDAAPHIKQHSENFPPIEIKS